MPFIVPFIFRSKVPIFSREGPEKCFVITTAYCHAKQLLLIFEQNILNIQYSVDATIKLNIYDNLYIDFSEIDGC